VPTVERQLRDSHEPCPQAENHLPLAGSALQPPRPCRFPQSNCDVVSVYTAIVLRLSGRHIDSVALVRTERLSTARLSLTCLIPNRSFATVHGSRRRRTDIQPWPVVNEGGTATGSAPRGKRRPGASTPYGCAIRSVPRGGHSVDEYEETWRKSPRLSVSTSLFR
jgi:hypothetical protein